MTTQTKVYYRNALLACFFLFTAVISSNFNPSAAKTANTNEFSLYQARNATTACRACQTIYYIHTQKQVLASPDSSTQVRPDVAPLQAQVQLERAPLLLAYSIFIAAP